MQFASEDYSNDLIKEMFPLWKAHHEEIAGGHYGPLDPDLRVYERCFAVGTLRIFTVRVAGALQGYQVFMVSPHPHSKRSLQAVQDILYIAPQARRGLCGYRFIKWCGEQLKREGVKIIHQHISARHDFGRILYRLGYDLEDLVFSKNLVEA